MAIVPDCSCSYRQWLNGHGADCPVPAWERANAHLFQGPRPSLRDAGGVAIGTSDKAVADMSPADIAAHGIPLSVVAQRKVEAAVAKKAQALRNDHWTAANVWQKEADVWQEVLDILGAQAGA